MTAPRRSVRAILVDDEDQLVLLKRTRPGQPPYWVAPGGGIEPSDRDLPSALRRELREELGAEADILSEVLVDQSDSEADVANQQFFLTRLVSLDEDRRTGAEFQDAARGSYEVERVDLRRAALHVLDLRPAALKRFILTNAGKLLTAIADRGATCPDGQAPWDKT